MNRLTTTQLQAFITRNTANAATLVKLNMLPSAKRIVALVTEAQRELEARVLGELK